MILDQGILEFIVSYSLIKNRWLWRGWSSFACEKLTNFVLFICFQVHISFEPLFRALIFFDLWRTKYESMYFHDNRIKCFIFINILEFAETDFTYNLNKFLFKIKTHHSFIWQYKCGFYCANYKLICDIIILILWKISWIVDIYIFKKH